VTQASDRPARRRSRADEPRGHVLKVKQSAAEKAKVAAAAARAGLAPAAWAGQTLMDAAEFRAVPVPVMQREILAELMRVRGLVRRAGVNLNQAVARLNTTGQPGLDLQPSAVYCARVLGHVDQAAEVIRRRLG
jgi:hypothetical protein